MSKQKDIKELDLAKGVVENEISQAKRKVKEVVEEAESKVEEVLHKVKEEVVSLEHSAAAKLKEKWARMTEDQQRVFKIMNPQIVVPEKH